MKVREITGLAIALMGAVLLVNLFLPVWLPLAEIACAVLLIWAGCCLLQGQRLSLFSEEETETVPPQSQPLVKKCLACREMLDLTDTDNLPEYVRVQSILGSVTVRLPVDAQITLVKNGLVGLVRAPGGRITLLGEDQSVCGSFDECAPRLYVEAHALLGEVRLLMG